METYKFRGKRSGDGKWTYGSLIGNDVIVGNIVEFNDEWFNTEWWYKVTAETVGQLITHYSNGQDLYEDDIVKIIDEDGEERFCKVGFRGLVEYSYDGYDYYYIDTLEDMGLECHVVGNVFDNPELLTNNDL